MFWWQQHFPPAVSKLKSYHRIFDTISTTFCSEHDTLILSECRYFPQFLQCSFLSLIKKEEKKHFIKFYVTRSHWSYIANINICLKTACKNHKTKKKLLYTLNESISSQSAGEGAMLSPTATCELCLPRILPQTCSAGNPRYRNWGK